MGGLNQGRTKKLVKTLTINQEPDILQMKSSVMCHVVRNELPSFYIVFINVRKCVTIPRDVSNKTVASLGSEA